MLEAPFYYPYNVGFIQDKSGGNCLLEKITEILSKEEFNYLKKLFDEFYNTIIKNSINYSAKSELKKQKILFRQYFYADFYLFFGLDNTIKSLIEDKKRLIDFFAHQRFFYANLAVAGLNGDLKQFRAKIQKANTLTQSVSRYNLNQYYNIWRMVDEDKISRRKACKKNITSENWDDEGRLYSRFMAFNSRNKIKSLKDFEIYLETLPPEYVTIQR